MSDVAVDGVLAELGVRPRRILPLKVGGDGNSNWRLDLDDGQVVVLRRYHHRATAEDLAYEHAVLRHVASCGWVVPLPLTDVVQADGALHCLTAYVEGAAVQDESPGQQARRGRDLAGLHHCLRDLELGQRPGWRSQHEGPSVHRDVDWAACTSALSQVDPTLASWASAAADAVATELDELGASELPVAVVHGDFASWNVHYVDDGRLAGVLDFGLTHLDSRPYELAIARTYRAPAMVAAYRSEAAALGWPLSDLEVATLEPMQRAFRVDMAAWSMDVGLRSGSFDLAMIRRQLERTGMPAP